MIPLLVKAALGCANYRRVASTQGNTSLSALIIGFLIGWSAEFLRRSKFTPLPGGLTSRARCIIGAWSVSPCCLVAWLETDSIASGRLGAAYYITRSRGEPRLQAASRSLLLRQLEPPQSQTAIMGYDFRRPGQFDAPSALCRLALAVSSIG
jgi:hypothetical protein